MIGMDLLRYKPDQKYIVPDKETEGVNLFYSRPWEIAYLIADANRIYERVTEYIWWDDLKVSDGAARITGFDFKTYKEQAKPAAEVLARYEERLFDPSMLVVGQNFYFDAYMHKTWRRALGMPEDFSWMDRMFDTHCLFKAMKKGWAPDRTNYRAWQYRVQNWREKGLKSNLGLICREFGIEYDERDAHKALYDIEKTREVWEQIKWKVEV